MTVRLIGVIVSYTNHSRNEKSLRRVNYLLRWKLRSGWTLARALLAALLFALVNRCVLLVYNRRMRRDRFRVTYIFSIYFARACSSLSSNPFQCYYYRCSSLYLCFTSHRTTVFNSTKSSYSIRLNGVRC